jgi:hypothetical protein
MTDNMNAKNYLKKIRQLDNKINNKIAEKYRLECLATHITPVLSDMKVQTSPNADKTSDICLKIIETEQEINQMIDDFVDMRDGIILMLEGMTEHKYYDILHKIYVQYWSLGRVAKATGYEYQSIKNMHCQALDAFYNQYLK